MTARTQAERIAEAQRVQSDIDRWDRCYPGNINMERIAGEASTTISDLLALIEAERRGAERMRERAAAEVEASAAIVDHPSVFMGGPSRNAQRIANSFAKHVRALPLTEETPDD